MNLKKIYTFLIMLSTLSMNMFVGETAVESTVQTSKTHQDLKKDKKNNFYVKLVSISAAVVIPILVGVGFAYNQGKLGGGNGKQNEGDELSKEGEGNLGKNEVQEEKQLSTGAEDSKEILKLNEPKAGGKNLKQPVIEVIQAEEPEESKNNTGIDPLLIVEPSSGKGPGDGMSNLNNKEIKNQTEQDSQENKSVPDDQSGKKNTDEEKGKDNMVGNTQEFLVGKGAIQKSNQGPQSQKIARDNQKGDNDSSYNWDDTKAIKNLDYIPDMKEKHNNKTGCHNHEFEVWRHGDVESNNKILTGKLFADPHYPKRFFKKFKCDICRNDISVCFYAGQAVSLLTCKNYTQHAARGGFHVCRACVAGKARKKCSRCYEMYVRLENTEKKGICVPCAGYDKLKECHQEITTMAGLPLFIEPPEIAFDSSKTYPWIAEAKKINDENLAKKLQEKMTDFKKRYVHHTDNEKWPLKELIKEISSLTFSNEDEVLSLLEKESEIIICPFYHYSWGGHRWYPGGPPHKSQEKVLCFVRSVGANSSDQKAYMLLLASDITPTGT